MKKKAAFLALSALLVSTEIYCDSNELKKNPSEQITYSNRIYLGPELFLFDLNTHVKSVKIDDARFFWGLRFRYEYLKSKAFYAGVDLLSSFSSKDFNATYRGHNFHGGNDWIGFGNFEFRLGYTFAPKSSKISPFLGIGSYAFGNSNSYEAMAYYVGGVRSLFNVNPAFGIGLNLKVFYTDDALRKFKFSFMGHRIRYIKHFNSWGGEIGIPLAWYLGSSKRWEVQFEPYFLRLNFSEIQNIYGTRLLFGYRF
jgi:hypothetical protein